MAEGGDVPKSKRETFCRYYMHGQCRFPVGCKNSHDRSKQPDMTCRYYLAGNCSYGKNCRYDHIKPQKHEDSSRFQQSTSSGFRSTDSIKSTKKIKMTQMKRDDATSSLSPQDSAWAEAAEFVPGQAYTPRGTPSSFCAALKTNLDNCDSTNETQSVAANGLVPLCPFVQTLTECPHGESCQYIHGDVCDLCDLPVLHPHDLQQQERHRKECVDNHERHMQLSFKEQASRDKQCSVCLEVVRNKQPSTEARFGIMSNCNHCFCLSCIRTWRSSKTNEQVRACPECRVKSDFVTPSKYWFEDEEDKKRLIEDYKTALKSKPCKYFDEGRGDCYLGSKCFYKHAYPNGKLASPRPPRRRRREDDSGNIETVFDMLLVDFIMERESRARELDVDELHDLFMFADLLDEPSLDSDDDLFDF